MILCWTIYKIPNPEEDVQRVSNQISKVLVMPGTALVLSTTYVASSAIYISYTYLAPILKLHGIGSQVGFSLLLFGAGAVAGILVTGKFIDQYLRKTLLVSMILGAISLLIIGVAGDFTLIIYISIVIWGYSFGGLPSLLQTATIRTTMGAYELGSSMTVTVYNIGVFSGGIIGGLIVDSAGPYQLTWVSFSMITMVIVLIILGKSDAFPK
ncbi:MFS transporter [Flavobacterium psychroterrae]|uniref:MFS transporter n=1 Tax=Flavobacterium psychroterrae TaxID=2133767 RepID=A0ABS5PIV9_9FLAO|nr:MFS transporter [Flavobacterium psychroterrae]MBS7234091.1 MFS transporter [Flavobacterium psychroterrae]